MERAVARPLHGRDARSLVAMLSNRERSEDYYYQWYGDEVVDEDHPFRIEAALCVYGYDPVLRLFVFREHPTPGIPVNQELACAMAMTVPDMSADMEAKRIAEIEEWNNGKTLDKEALMELYDLAQAESRRDILPFAFFSFGSLSHDESKVHTGFEVRHYLPINHALAVARLPIIGRAPDVT